MTKMQFWFKHSGEGREFLLARTGDDVIVTLDGKDTQLSVTTINNGHFSITHNGRTHEALVHNHKGECQVLIGGHDVRFAFKTARQLRRAQAGGSLTSGSGDVISPMPGKIVALKVKSGQGVGVGDGVVVVEAMKMQNELKASVAGVVKAIKVKEGDSVEGGMVLVVIT